MPKISANRGLSKNNLNTVSKEIKVITTKINCMLIKISAIKTVQCSSKKFILFVFLINHHNFHRQKLCLCQYHNIHIDPSSKWRSKFP